MSKLTYQDKINSYNDRKNGMSVRTLSIKYNVRKCLIDKHGFDILRTNKNKIHINMKNNKQLIEF